MTQVQPSAQQFEHFDIVWAKTAAAEGASSARTSRCKSWQETRRVSKSITLNCKHVLYLDPTEAARPLVPIICETTSVVRLV